MKTSFVMINPRERARLQGMYRRLCTRIRATGVKGVKLRTVQLLVVHGHRFEFKPSHWRVLVAVISRNSSVLSLPPKLVAFRVVHNPDALETPEARKRKEALQARSAYKPPIGQKCPDCGDMSLFVEFRNRSTGPGRKVEQVQLNRCMNCGLS